MNIATDKEKILRFYRGTEGENISVKLYDLAKYAADSGKFRVSPFLSPYEQDIAETIAANFVGVSADFFGGYQGAERCRAMFTDDTFKGKPSFEIAVIKAEWRGEFTRLSHRDVLGSLMSLGVDRAYVGDIIATGESAKILIDEKMQNYFLENLKEIGGASVKCSLDELSSIAPKEERVKEISATVASLRIDSVAAAGFGMSRSKAAADILADKIKLNWQSVKNASVSVKEGDMLSIRGRGRVEVAEIRGTTKKGRIGITLKRYI